MIALTVVTGNLSKFREFQAILGKSLILKNKKLDLTEPKTLSQEEVAISTAKQAYEILKEPLITDDTGIFFANYHNFPGTYTKFLLQTLGFDGLKRLISVENSKAFYQTTLCYTDGKRYKTFQGKLEGNLSLSASPIYNKDWGYDSIFIPSGANKFFSEFSLEDRIQISHRAKAIEKLFIFLKTWKI